MQTTSPPRATGGSNAGGSNDRAGAAGSSSSSNQNGQNGQNGAGGDQARTRVSTEGVRVLGLLSECVGARGCEAETYFESALRDAQLIPGLEGSTHINFGLTAQFLDNYFAHGDPKFPAR